MKVNIVTKKLIKPSTPTPENLKNYKISLIDELSTPNNVRVLLFYQSKVKRINLEESLAKILSQFYVLAGRYIKKDHLVDCSDQGAEFVEAEAEDVDVKLIHLIGKLKGEQLNDLLPRQSYDADEAAMDPLLSIQVTELKTCDGLVIGISVPHRIFDASSIGTFISAWSNVNSLGPAGSEGKITINPIFDTASLFPGKNLDFAPDVKPNEMWDPSVCVKRLLFTKEDITSLRSKFQPNNGKESKRMISRVRVVCALIAKALIAVDQEKYGKPRPCLIVQPVNIRERTIPRLPKHSCGNLCILSLTRSIDATEIEEMRIQELVHALGDAVEKTIADCAEILSLGEDGLNNIILNPMKIGMERLLSVEANVMGFTDWSKFEFYEADFGSGKPIWASIGPLPGENMTVLMDNREGGGIEAWVHLKPNDMAYFEQVEDIKLFTT